MRKLTVIFFGFFLLLLTANVAQAQCSATWSHTSSGHVASFSSSVSGFTTPYYYWDFGDGTWSLASDPTHTYSKPGTYTVTLFAYSKRGNEYGSSGIPIKITESEYDDLLNTYTESQQQILAELIGKWRIFYASEVITDCQTAHVDSLYSRITENIQYTFEFFLDQTVIINDENGINELAEWQLIGDRFILLPEFTLSGSLISNPLTGLELGGLYEFSAESGTFLSWRDILRENSKPQINCENEVYQTLRMESVLLVP